MADRDRALDYALQNYRKGRGRKPGDRDPAIRARLQGERRLEPVRGTLRQCQKAIDRIQCQLRVLQTDFLGIKPLLEKSPGGCIESAQVYLSKARDELQKLALLK